MWRDSFAVNRLVTTTLGPVSRQLPAESIEDDYLLEVERRANRMRRKDTHSFEPMDDEDAIEEGKKVPFKMPSRRFSITFVEEDEEEEKEEEAALPPDAASNDFGLLARTPPVESALPGVDDLFSSPKDQEEKSVFQDNPLAPQTPPQMGRKVGSFVEYLRAAASSSSKGNRHNHQDDTASVTMTESVNPGFNDYRTKLRSPSSDEDPASSGIFASRASASTAMSETPQSPAAPTSRVRSTRVSVGRAIQKSLSFVKNKRATLYQGGSTPSLAAD